jgi:hypothetical protein
MEENLFDRTSLYMNWSGSTSVEDRDQLTSTGEVIGEQYPREVI